MLVLTRKTDEEFRFPQLGIRVQILASHNNRVRVGIDAPRELAITRGDNPSDSTEQQDLAFIDKRTMNSQLEQIKSGLKQIQSLYQAGKHEEAEQTLRESLTALTSLELSASQSKADEVEPANTKVLLVEDDANERSLLMSLLEIEGYDVVAAKNGEEALEILNVTNPDFVLMDMRMPIMDGRETIEQIRHSEETKTLPVFAVSSTCPEQVGVPINENGVNGWFEKPLDPAAMLRELRSHSNDSAI